MNNLKKIGLSALAGSLVAFSANAVEMGVTGTAEVTYTTSGGKGVHQLVILGVLIQLLVSQVKVM